MSVKKSEKNKHLGNTRSFYKSIIDISPIGYAYHKILLDKNNQPCDYEFIEVNHAFEIMTNLKADEIIGKKVTEVFPEIKKSKFDWINFYGKVASKGNYKKIEQYSEVLGRWYRIEAFSLEKNYFITCCVDITREKQQFIELNNFFEVNLDLLCIADSRGRFLKVNKEWEFILGYKKEELEKKNFLDFVHPDDLEDTLKAICKLKKQEEVLNFVNRYKAKDGSYRYIEWRSKPNENLIYAAARDITHSKLAENKLEEAKKKYQSLVKNIPGITYRCKLDKNWTMVFMSDAIQEISGYHARDFINSQIRSYESIIHPDDKNYVNISIYKAIAEKKCWDIEYRIRKKNGEDSWVQERGNIIKDEESKEIYLDGFILDINDKKKAEEEFKKSQDRYKYISEHSPVGLFQFKRSPQGKREFVYISQGFKNILGIDTEKTMKDWKYLHDKIHQSYKESFKDEMDLSALTLKQFNFTFLFKTDTKGEIWIELKADPQKNPDGSILWTGVFIDIDSKKRLEEKLLLAKKQAEESNLAKSYFLANMSHEIRTPMNGILGFLQLLENTTLTDEQLDYINIMKSSTDTLLNLINDILDVSKIEAGKIELENIGFNLRSTLEGGINPLLVKADEKGLDINILLRSEVPQYVKGDPTRLKQIITNLVSNAVKFTEKGEILLKVDIVDKKENIAYIKFSIKDTGIGLTDEITEKLFSPFVQADSSSTRKYGGTGLGLTICKSYVEAMGGKIHVESEEGKGSIFSFTVALEISNEIQDLPKIDFDILKGKRIMIVDNNKTNRMVLKIILQETGCIVDMVNSAEEAISILLKEDKNAFNAILVDYNMPNMNGADLAAALKAIPSTKDIPLILITSVGVKGEAKRAQESGFIAYLTKPYKKIELLNCISMVVGEKNFNKESEKSFITRHTIKEAEYNKRTKILLVEDNEVNCKLFTKLLQSNGYNCDIAMNGEEALRAYVNKDYDLIFMDCQMPVMDGYEATRKIRELEGGKKHTPIIAITAYSMQGDREKCIQAGMDDYISKPISLKEVYRVLMENIKMEKNEADSNSLILNSMDIFYHDTGISKEDSKELYDEYIKQLPEYINEIREAIGIEDYGMIKKLSHKLKGASGNLRISPAYDLSKKLEEYAGKEEKIQCSKIIDEIEGLFQ